jgi:hypothetical protein
MRRRARSLCTVTGKTVTADSFLTTRRIGGWKGISHIAMNVQLMDILDPKKKDQMCLGTKVTCKLTREAREVIVVRVEVETITKVSSSVPVYPALNGYHLLTLIHQLQ